ncbi:MAG: 4-hydroxy-3-methylbut-2-enyl diphosphate reductase [Erysipelotrichaceae bacterium]|nr:4-hydroxy-3-methylbut-2-enyl diphosphate reductase [Erysipelotrichaceae bacterium]
MEIQRVYPSGFCKGVINAINLARKTREENPDETITVLGMIVHNSRVTNSLEEFGIKTLDDPALSREELLEKINEGIVIFTAHGISDAIKEKAIQKGLKVVDASCEDVLKTKNLIRDHLREGYDVLYFGKKGHPEAEAILSLSDKIHLLTSLKDIEELDLDNPKLLLTNQTTMSYLELEDLFKVLKKKYPHIKEESEICKATSQRQKAIYGLEDCDLLYVVGDRKSNNTAKLKEIGEKRGIKKVILISSYEEIKDDDLTDVRKVCVTAGASTPPEAIEEVLSCLRSKA